MKLGDRSRCLICGGRIIIVDYPGINLGLGMWTHESGLRRFVANHPAKGPTS